MISSSSQNAAVFRDKQVTFAQCSVLWLLTLTLALALALRPLLLALGSSLIPFALPPPRFKHSLTLLLLSALCSLPFALRLCLSRKSSVFCCDDLVILSDNAEIPRRSESSSLFHHKGHQGIHKAHKKLHSPRIANHYSIFDIRCSIFYSSPSALCSLLLSR
jgi:hypothetical protein